MFTGFVRFWLYILLLAASSTYSPIASATKHGEFNTQRNIYTTGWAKLRHKAELGDPDALFTLGNYYYQPPKGSLFRKNLKKSSEYYFKAALRKNAAAQYNLALMLHKGLGINENRIDSYAWFSIASINNSPVAKHINQVSLNAIKTLNEQLTEKELEKAKIRIQFLTSVIASERFRKAKAPK